MKHSEIGTTKHQVKISKTIFCDKCIAYLVKTLNEGGIKTVASCCGHGKINGNIVLENGKVLIIADFDDDMKWQRLLKKEG